ncbi:peptidase S8/S53 domain-containing protein [Mycena metata]|uniref:Peptidase S8/S53 domain-containing protein n=1 Tax=Mycena metata TaxID=1033252 RepID=A0AAD7J1Y4_9AGAR|nr:peptidase S8/S53 domain-containing protein [Mycena metata]
MVSLRFPSIAALMALAIATPTDRSALLVHEQRAQPARGFVSTGPAPSDAELALRIALKPNNIAGLESELYAVAECVKPTSDALSAVTSWLQTNKISATTISPAGDVLQLKIPVSRANSLFNTKFSILTHLATDDTIRTLQYSLPVELSAAVAYIHPTTTFSRPFAVPKSQPLRSNSKRDIDPTCADIVMPSCLQAEYGIPTTSATQTNNALGQFLAEYRPDLPATTTFDVDLLDGGSNTQVTVFAGLEASLDIDYTIGLASGVPVKFIAVCPLDNDAVGGFLDQINALISDPSRPTVLTTSYGVDEEDMTLPVAQGLRLGTSILFASGDGGVAGTDFETTFVPTAPSTCPWVTSIGSSQTILENFTKNNFSEIGAVFSSGGAKALHRVRVNAAQTQR